MVGSNSPEENSELIELGLALLSFAAGVMDALAFSSLGEVFPSAMTGNAALLGLGLGQGNLIGASRPFVAFAGFLVGAGIASASLERWLSEQPASRNVWMLLAFEACLLAVFALIWRFGGRPGEGVWLYGVIVIAASAMGIQSVVARLVDRFGISTVVFTSVLTSIITTSMRAIMQSHPLPFATRRQAGIFLTYGVGAGIGGGLAAAPELVSVLPCAAVIAAAVINWHAESRNCL